MLKVFENKNKFILMNEFVDVLFEGSLEEVNKKKEEIQLEQFGYIKKENSVIFQCPTCKKTIEVSLEEAEKIFDAFQWEGKWYCKNCY